MSRTLSASILISGLVGSTTVFADVPKVAVDIAPVHSLVARVMDGIGEPSLVVPAGASPHEYSLRPSEAAALQDADLVFVIGADLAPWLSSALETLAADAAITEFLHANETELLEFRESALFEAHIHDDHDEEHDDHDKHDDHESHGDDDHDEHEDAHDDHDEHGHDDNHEDHGAHDTHVWLSPENAKAWLNVIAAQLSAADPDNAGAYFANAAAGQAELDTVITNVNEILAPARGMSFVVFHDAYQYFETSFDFPAAGAISLSDASEPSPARIAEIQARIQNEGIDCVLAEPQYNDGLVATVLDGTEAGTSVIDPLGSSLEPGKSLYPALLTSLATALAECG